MGWGPKDQIRVPQYESASSLVEKIRKEILEGDYVAKYLPAQAAKGQRNFALSWYQVLEVVEAERTSDTTARLVLRFPVQREYLNHSMTLQGGIQASMFDGGTTCVLSLVRKEGFWMKFGTSRSLNVTYIRPAVEGDVLLLECELVHAGKRLCLLRGSLLREKDRALISTCEHQKVNIDGDVAKA